MLDLRSISWRSSNLYLNNLSPPQTSILLRGLFQGEPPTKVVCVYVLELIWDRKWLNAQNAFSPVSKALACTIWKMLYQWNLYIKYVKYRCHCIFTPEILFMIDTTTNGKFQHISQLEFWNVDQLIQSIFWCVFFSSNIRWICDISQKGK